MQAKPRTRHPPVSRRLIRGTHDLRGAEENAAPPLAITASEIMGPPDRLCGRPEDDALKFRSDQETPMSQGPENPKETARLKAELEAQAARQRELEERLRKKKDGKAKAPKD